MKNLHADFFKTVTAIFITGYLVLFCGVKAGTVEDIRDTTKWQSPNYSERAANYIPTVTPDELAAGLDKYYKDTVKMQVLFFGVSTRALNVRIKDHGNVHRWASKQFISFRVKDPRNKLLCRDINLFISKNHPDAGILPRLAKNTKITITGRVKNTAYGKAWINVTKIEV